MKSIERLIEYHFQRKLAGVSEDEIRQSLSRNIMDDEERESMIRLILKLEATHLKKLQRQKQSRRLHFSALLILLIGIGWYALSAYGSLSTPPWYGLLLFIPAVLSSAAAAVLGRS